MSQMSPAFIALSLFVLSMDFNIGADFMGPKGLEPPNIWAPRLMQYMSPLQYSARTVYVNDINFDSRTASKRFAGRC